MSPDPQPGRVVKQRNVLAVLLTLAFVVIMVLLLNQQRLNREHAHQMSEMGAHLSDAIGVAKRHLPDSKP